MEDDTPPSPPPRPPAPDALDPPSPVPQSPPSLADPPETPGDTSQSSSLSAADVANKAMAFLSTAPPEQLIAVSVGGAMLLCMVLGSLGLLVVGVVVGVVGHATLGLPELKKGPSGLSVAIHEWFEARNTIGEVGSGVVNTKASGHVDFSSLPPETAKAMEELTDAIARDYIRYWYSPLLPDDDKFPNSCRNVIANTLLSMYSHISRKRGADTFLLFLISTSNTFIVFLRELAAAQQSSVGTYIEKSPSSALAQLLDRDLQKRKLKMAADDVLESFFGRDVLQCEPVRIFLTEILAGVVLEMVVDKCSKPDWINDWIVYLLEEETQPEILQKIDISEASAATNENRLKANRISHAEDEMARAMEEAKELTRMIVEEEERKRKSMNAPNGDGDNNVGGGKALPEPKKHTPPISAPESPQQAFTSFDQLPPQAPPTPREETIHRAHVSLSDLTQAAASTTPNEKSLRAKPTSTEYLLQIEPASPSMPGWVVVRKYIDFETLHEVLRRIAAISGAESFRRHHPELPTWREETLGSLRFNLEGYLNDALHDRTLAESEGMKRFFEKDTAYTNKSGAFAGLGKGWPNPATFAKMSQGALDVLSKAPQGVAGGGKGLFGGMKKAFTVANQREESGTPQIRKRESIDPFGELPIEYQNPSSREPVTPRFSTSPSRTSLHQPTHSPSTSISSASKENYIQLELPSDETSDKISISLPPPPSDMPDDFVHKSTTPPPPPATTSPASPPPPLQQPDSKKEPLTVAETQFIVDITFSILSELYTLSSAWTLRRSLLNIAKSLILRPNSPSLENIRVLIQESLIDAYTSDAAVAGLVRQLRENAFPTEEELAVWKAKLEAGEQEGGETLRLKARELLVRRGVPETLKGVMGAVASEQALGEVFDALQMGAVARGVLGGVILEGVRGVCQ